MYKNIKTTTIAIFLFALVVYLGICKTSVIEKISDKYYPNKNPSSNSNTFITDGSNKSTTETQIEYINTEYNFTFSLPNSWKGYSIINSDWEGNLINTSSDNQETIGPKILIRHPLWTSEKPRQDIPIMIFTQSQWDLVQKEEISIGAAPIPPSELNRNNEYVFALPARYNFALPNGFEEVIEIIKSKPLHS